MNIWRWLVYTAPLLCGSINAEPAAKHPLSPGDIYRLQTVDNPEISPDGEWVVYTVTSADKDTDKQVTHLWMVSWDGKQNLQLTYSTESDSNPKWDHEGKMLGFLSSRPGKAKGTQVWVLDRRGGEARQVTSIAEDQEIEAFSFGPDAKHLLLSLRDTGKPKESDKKDHNAPPIPPKPIVIDRYHFKSDEAGYIGGFRYVQLYLYNLDSNKAERVTNFTRGDERDPVLSPDQSRIAFVNSQDEEADRTNHSDVWVVDAKPNATPKRLTSYAGMNGGRPAWSPDGKWIAYVQGTEPKFYAYDTPQLAVVSSDGSAASHVISSKLDRGVSEPVFSTDSQSVTASVEDDRNQYPARFPVTGNSYERLIGGSLIAAGMRSAGDRSVLLSATDDQFPEICAWQNGSLRKLTSHNQQLLSELQLGQVREFGYTSAQNTEVHGLLTLPPNFDSSKKYPALLRIHGGPSGQDSHGLEGYNLEHQFLAAGGYVVIAINYRGGSGRGHRYAESIFADWGHHEVEDLLAGVDAAVKMGFVDAGHLGIGGWSYGGILTDYTIATDGRFKAATSGAGSANQISMYGSDQYVFQYDNEIGPPWKSPKAWMDISYPFFHADHIHTPTLFLGGTDDFNVPIIGGEQMYQALKTQGVPTELIVYPGQHHGISKPSFQKDRLERYLAWYDKYLK